MFWFKSTNNYNKSNSITDVNFCISGRAKEIVAKLLNISSEQSRQELGDMLLDELADLSCIDIVKLKVSAAHQYHKKYNGKVVFKQYGYYKPGAQYIYITNRTAVRGQHLAPKTFVDTLLHEWMHHYDYCKLKLRSIHTAGFYARLKDLKTKLGYFNS